MLISLNVQNFAIIDNISLEFKKGFTVLTGETGAGKSLIIDAIGILLGDRFLQSMIRNGETKASIEGVFDNISNNTKETLQDLGFENDDNLLIIKREVNNQGRNIIRINGSMATLTNLETITKALADIHTQEDTMKLFNKENYLTFVESNESLEVLKRYQLQLKEYNNCLKTYNNIVDDYETTLQNLDYLKYQQNELKNSNLQIGETEKIIEELKYLNNYENIFRNLNEIKEHFEDCDITKGLYDILQNLNELTKYDQQYNKIKEIVNNAYYDLDDIEHNINNKLEHLEFDEDRLNKLNERLNLINSLIKKYHRPLPDLIIYLDELNKKINNYESNDLLIKEAKEEVIKKVQLLKATTNELTIIRKNNALELTQNIKKSLSELMLDKVKLEIIFNEPNFNDDFNSKPFKKNGCDEIDFMISFNPGEAMHSLSKVASGGEMSRVMLAIKTHAQAKLQLATMIFDEIDTGISGNVAAQVGLKLQQISKSTQVFAITHLPIVASLADNHLLISKEVINERTITKVKELSLNERINELAVMISPKDKTEKSKELAKTMLESAQK